MSSVEQTGGSLDNESGEIHYQIYFLINYTSVIQTGGSLVIKFRGEINNNLLAVFLNACYILKYTYLRRRLYSLKMEPLSGSQFYYTNRCVDFPYFLNFCDKSFLDNNFFHFKFDFVRFRIVLVFLSFSKSLKPFNCICLTI